MLRVRHITKLVKDLCRQQDLNSSKLNHFYLDASSLKDIVPIFGLFHWVRSMLKKDLQMLEISNDLKIMIVVGERYYELLNLCLFCFFLASLLLYMLQMKKCNNPT